MTTTSRTILRRAFTLVELLVVVAIIAVLITILIPAMSRARAQAFVATCASNQRQLATAVSYYAADWDDRYPVWGSLPTINFNSQPYLRNPYWDGLLYRYMNPGTETLNASQIAKRNAKTVYLCPIVEREVKPHQTGAGGYNSFRSYKYNWLLGGFATSPTSLNGNGAITTPLKRPAVGPDVALFVESLDHEPLGSPDGYYGLLVRTWEDVKPPHLLSRISGTYSDAWNSANPKNTGTLNITFADGHVERLTYAKTAKLSAPADVKLTP